MDAANATHRGRRRARPGSPARPENAPFSRRSRRAFSGDRRSLPRRSAHSVPENAPFSRRSGHSPSGTWRLSPPPFTAHCCSPLRTTCGPGRARRTRSAEQWRTEQRVAPCRRGSRCGSSASMLCSRVSSRPCRSTTSSIAVRERSCTAHDTAPVSRILSQYPGILRQYPRYQGGIQLLSSWQTWWLSPAAAHHTDAIRCTGHGGRHIEQHREHRLGERHTVGASGAVSV